MSQLVLVVSIGLIYDNDKNSHGYYIVVFNSSPCTIQENTTFDDQVLESVEIVSGVRYFSPTTAK